MNLDDVCIPRTPAERCLLHCAIVAMAGGMRVNIYPLAAEGLGLSIEELCVNVRDYAYADLARLATILTPQECTVFYQLLPREEGEAP